jgi:glutamate carboxypeptidase
MHATLAYATRNLPAIKKMLREMVECESPSDSPADVNRFHELLASQVKGLATVKLIPCGPQFGKAMLCEFTLPGPRRKGGEGILGVGHADTVWALGALKTMPFRERDGRLWGPGVLDMKAGLAFFIWAARCLRDHDLPVNRPVRMWVVPDEEVGSEGSRALTEKHAKESKAVLVLEPGTGLTGKLKTARKGVGDFTVRVKGKASHAGVDFGAGASAVLELSQQVMKIAGFTDLSRGITVNPGVIRGGTRTNVIAESAECEVDMRIARLRDAAPLERKFRSLRPIDKRCTIEVSGGLNRPPMERTKGVATLYRTAEKLASTHLGLALEESATGGGSDGNFTAALGVPTLDGIGAVGEGAHASNESILVDRIADRVALLALLVHHLGQ